MFENIAHDANSYNVREPYTVHTFSIFGGIVVEEIPTDTGKPVLFVPGYTDAVGQSTRSSDSPADPEDLYPRWETLANNLRERGYEGPIDYAQLGPLGFTVGSPRKYGGIVAAKIVEMYETYGEPVNVIAHSMGGLSTRWAVEKEGAAEYVDTVVTKGTPHRGTKLAWFGMLTPGGRDMRPNSSFIRELNADGVEESVDYVSLYSSRDLAFVLGSSERASIPYEEQYENVENIKLSGHSHMDLVTSEAVLDEYYESLL